MGTIYGDKNIVTDGLYWILDVASPKGLKNFSGGGATDDGSVKHTLKTNLVGYQTTAAFPRAARWYGSGGAAKLITALNGVNFDIGYIPLNGTNDQIITSVGGPSTSSYNGIDFSYSIWFRSTESRGRKLIGLEGFAAYGPGSAYDKHIWIQSNGKGCCGVYSGSRNSIEGPVVNDGNWHQAVFLYKGAAGTGFEFYIDNVQQTTALEGSSSNISTDTPYVLKIGGYESSGWTNTSDGYCQADVGPVHFYKNKILTASEINQNFEALRKRFGV
tara:strand:- start:2175 stop:2993 length:819 start_codon:yes stop_codon:yes gene_type:complete